MNVKENVFSSERELKKALRDTFMRAAWYELNKGKLWLNCHIPLFRYFYNHLSNYAKTIIRLRLVNIGEYSMSASWIWVGYNQSHIQQARME